MKRLALFLSLALSALPASAEEASQYWEFSRTVVPAADDRPVAAALDKHALGRSAEGFDDLRISAVPGGDVPYFIFTQSRTQRVLQALPSTVVSKEMNQTESRITVDLGSAKTFNRVILATGPKNFIRAIDVLGSEDGQNWTPVRRDLLVYSLRHDHSSTYISRYFENVYIERSFGRWVNEDLEVDVPPSQYRFVRVSMPHNLDKEPVELASLEVQAVEEDPVLEDAFPAEIVKKEVADEGKAMEYTADFGEALPVSRIAVEAAEQNYFRDLTIEYSADMKEWARAGEGRVLSIAFGANKKSESETSFPEKKARYWRVRMQNGDNRPLDVRSITGYASRRYAVFLPQKGATYTLRYGHAGAKRPVYDAARTMAGGRFSDFAGASLGEPVKNPGFKAWVEPKAWTESRPALLWGAMIAVIGGFLFLAMQQVKKVDGK